MAKPSTSDMRNTVGDADLGYIDADLDRGYSKENPAGMNNYDTDNNGQTRLDYEDNRERSGEIGPSDMFETDAPPGGFLDRPGLSEYGWGKGNIRRN